MIAKRFVLSGLLIFLMQLGFSQIHVAGFVKDSLSGEALIGAYVTETGTTNGTATDPNGYFTLVTRGAPLKVSYIGYKSRQVEYPKGKSHFLTISLSGGEEIHEVVVLGQNAQRFSMATLSNKEMLSIPALGGKPDVLKAMQLLPGIQTTVEGTSLLMVRGGSPGENLYLIDNIPLIYVNHLGGFISVFNPDMINHIEMYKGGFPAKYGGKLSSVVAMTQREGSVSETKGSLSIGVTDASFSVEGPFKNKKITYLVTGRKTLTEPLFYTASSIASQGYKVIYGFHDLNGKLSFKPDPQNNFYLNVYYGDDYIRFWSQQTSKNKDKNVILNIWGNWLVAGRWNRVFSSRLFADQTVSYTRYRYGVGQYFFQPTKTDTTEFSKQYTSTVQDFSLRSDWKYKLLPNWSVEFGGKATRLAHVPNRIERSNAAKMPGEQVNAWENALYANNHINLFNRVEADLGLRAVHYATPGFSDVSLEPRMMLNLKLTENQTLNASIQQVSQYAHLVLTAGTILTNEVWIPANADIAPGKSTQYSVGWKGNYRKGMFQTELEFYHKTLSHLSTYREGYSNLMGDGGWRNKIERGGEGVSQGVEFLVRKSRGHWTGFASYAWSHTTRQFPGINGGKEYVYEFDRPHSVSLFVSRKLSEKWLFNASWVYQTGLPYTPVLGRMLNHNLEECLIYGERNSERMRDYHRMDLGFTYTKRNKHDRKAEWNFSVYNLYSRRNPNVYYYNTSSSNFFGYSDPDEGYKPLKLYQVSYFPLIPSVSYKVYFDGKNERSKRERISFKERLRNYLFYEE